MFKLIRTIFGFWLAIVYLGIVFALFEAAAYVIIVCLIIGLILLFIKW